MYIHTHIYIHTDIHAHAGGSGEGSQQPVTKQKKVADDICLYMYTTYIYDMSTYVYAHIFICIPTYTQAGGSGDGGQQPAAKKKKVAVADDKSLLFPVLVRGLGEVRFCIYYCCSVLQCVAVGCSVLFPV